MTEKERRTVIGKIFMAACFSSCETNVGRAEINGRTSKSKQFGKRLARRKKVKYEGNDPESPRKWVDKEN